MIKGIDKTLLKSCTTQYQYAMPIIYGRHFAIIYDRDFAIIYDGDFTIIYLCT
jgi:hypothetical protein